MKTISFVVQGPIIMTENLDEGVYSTHEVLKSIRELYPESQIILSTWNGSDTSKLIYDKLVLSDDPGNIVINGVTINGNRLLITTKAGLAQATNQIVVKTRTDIEFVSNCLNKYINLISPVSSEYAIFDKFVLSTIYYVRDPLKSNWLFHPTDIFMVGENEDIKSFFDLSAASKNEFEDAEGKLKMVAEQYFFIENIFKKRNVNFRLPKANFVNAFFFLHSERYLFNNFLFFDTGELGIDFPARLYNAFMPEANYNVKLAQQLTNVYQNKLKYTTIVLQRIGKYVIKYIVWQGIKNAIKFFLKPVFKTKTANGNN